nr:136_t:CDS:10 [Entrophospora candida]
MTERAKIIPRWLTEVRPTTSNAAPSTWTLPNTGSLLNGNNQTDSSNSSFTTRGGTLSASPDQTRAVVVGLLKILNVSGNEITEELKVKVANKYNSNDVKWGNNISRNKIATAASNGLIVIWDIGNGRSRIDRRINEHTRAVNRICFSPMQGSLLLSASQDCTMKLWDLRDPEKARYTFQGRCDGVRDVQFNSMNQYEFAAAFDNGTIQKWDIRKPSIHQKRYNAHIGSVLSVDWNSDGRTIASGGRDKIIKIWDMNSDSRKSKNAINTMSGISYIRWRPNYPNEIASCSSLVDSRIFVWNVKRPYIPSYSFETHEEVPTGILWHDCDVLWSCSKDKYFMQQYIKGSYRPLDLLSKCGIGWSIYDQLAFAVDKPNNNNDIIDDQQQNQIKKTQKYIPPGTIDSSNEGYYKLQQKTGMASFKTFDYKAFSYLAENYMISNQNIWETYQNGAEEQHSKESHSHGPLKSRFYSKVSNNSANENSSSNNTPTEKTSEGGAGALDDDDSSIESEESEDEFVQEDKSSTNHKTLRNQKSSAKLSENAFICGPTIKTSLMPSLVQEQIISQLLDYYSEQGDVQMCVTLILVIGDRIKLNNERVEQWFFSYIELLHRFQLWVTATDIISSCPIAAVSMLNQQSTTIYTTCNNCYKHILNNSLKSNGFWSCDKCHKLLNPCSICHNTVKGLYTWCQGCSHGGHLTHMKQWFSRNNECPTGCGHNCSIGNFL